MNEHPTSSSLNPSTPPKADIEDSSHPAQETGRLKSRLREALQRLNEHVSNPGRVERDLHASMSRLYRSRLSFGVPFFVLSLVLCVAGAGDPMSLLFPVGLILALVSWIISLLAIWHLSLVKRDTPAAPEATLKSFLKSFSMGRYGYAWATLCPTAREQTARVPSLGSVNTDDGAFPMAHEAGLAAYAQHFARPGGEKTHQMAVKRVVHVADDGDVATVKVDAEFQSWPSWVNIAAALGFFSGLGAIPVLILFVLIRERHKASFTKTLLRAQNGVWYVYDANLIENPETG